MSDQEPKHRDGMLLARVELPRGIVVSPRLLLAIAAAAQIKGKPLSDVEILALMDSPSQAVH